MTKFWSLNRIGKERVALGEAGRRLSSLLESAVVVWVSYSLVHRVQAIRDVTCDEPLWEMRKELRKSDLRTTQFSYASDSPIDLERRQARLRCYRITSDGYETAVWHPTNEVPY